MTEQHSPFGGLAVAEPTPAEAPAEFDDFETGDNRRKLAIVGAVVAVVVVLIAAFFLLKGKDNGSDAGFAPHVALPASSGPAKAPKAAAAPAKAVKLPKAYSANVGRDPFTALYTPPADNPTGSGSTNADSTDTSTSTSTPGTTTGSGTTSTPTVAVSPVWVQLVKVFGNDEATFVVGFSNGKSLTTTTFKHIKAPQGAQSATVFGEVFGLVSIQNGKATIQYGDGTPIMIAVGHRLVVN
jgi:hypothetical protein